MWEYLHGGIWHLSLPTTLYSALTRGGSRCQKIALMKSITQCSCTTSQRWFFKRDTLSDPQVCEVQLSHARRNNFPPS